MNKVDKINRNSISWVWGASLLVIFVRLYKLSSNSLPDYDSVFNWEIVNQIAAGDLHNLFNHVSPAFYVVFTPLAALHLDFHWFEYFNVGLSVFAVIWLALFVGRVINLSRLEISLLILLAGTAVASTSNARDFSLSSLSLVLFIGLFQAYYKRVMQPSRDTLLQAAIWLALGISVNYKFLFAIPILILLELFCADRILIKWGNFWRLAFILSTPYILFGIIGRIAGMSSYRWLTEYVNIMSITNAAGRIGSIRLDVLYYPRFLFDFETPLFFGLALFPVIFYRELRDGFNKPNFYFYLAVWAYCFLGGMSLILKAPRGLLFVYGLFAVISFLSLRRLAAGRFITMMFITLASVGINVYHLNKEIFTYASSNYSQVGKWIKSHHINKIASTVGQSIVPFVAPDSVAVAVIMDEHQLKDLRAQGYQYVLLDSYWRPAHINHFEALRELVPVAAWPELRLATPLLFLEHSEYTGLGYDETLSDQRIAKQDSLQLRLLKL